MKVTLFMFTSGSCMLIAEIKSALNPLIKRKLTTMSPHWSAWKYEDRDDVDYPSRKDQTRFSHLKRNQRFKNTFSSSRYLKANDDFMICCKWKIYTGVEKRRITQIDWLFSVWHHNGNIKAIYWRRLLLREDTCRLTLTFWSFPGGPLELALWNNKRKNINVTL